MTVSLRWLVHTWIDLYMLITMYGSCTLITVYGSHISIPHVFHTGFSTCFSYIIFHMLHTSIIWESTWEPYTFHTWIILECCIGITCFKILKCGSWSHVEGTLMWLPYSSCVATIQLPCGYHTQYSHAGCWGHFYVSVLCGYHMAFRSIVYYMGVVW